MLSAFFDGVCVNHFYIFAIYQDIQVPSGKNSLKSSVLLKSKSKLMSTNGDIDWGETCVQHFVVSSLMWMCMQHFVLTLFSSQIEQKFQWETNLFI